MLQMTLKILIGSNLYDLLLRAMLNMTLQILINSKLYDLMLKAMLNMTLQIPINSKLYDLVLRAMLNIEKEDGAPTCTMAELVKCAGECCSFKPEDLKGMSVRWLLR